MSNNKFDFEFVKELLKFMIFSLTLKKKKKKNCSYCLSLKFIIFICLKSKKKIFPNYNKCKLLILTKKKKKNRRASEHAQRACLESSIYI